MNILNSYFIGIKPTWFFERHSTIFNNLKMIIENARFDEDLQSSFEVFPRDAAMTHLFKGTDDLAVLVADATISISTANINLKEWLAIAEKSNRLQILIIPKNMSTKSELTHQRFEIFAQNLDYLSGSSFRFPFVVFLLYEGTFVETIRTNYYPLSVSSIGTKEVINKSIEFTPEYYSAGLGILNFFSTYLREQYPNEKARVKIEQDGLMVRLIVTTTDGKEEIIQKALEEYGLIITGREVPEAVVNNDKLVLELKYELRMANVRLETQKDFINYQQATIEKFNRLLELNLSNNQPINVQVNPVITLSPVITSSNVVSVTFNMSQALKEIASLKSELPKTSKAHKDLQKVEKALDEIKDEKDPKVVKHSKGMGMLEEFLKQFNKDAGNVNKTIATGKKAWETFKQLAGTYNSIAQWCGLPQVPTIFTK